MKIYFLVLVSLLGLPLALAQTTELPQEQRRGIGFRFNLPFFLDGSGQFHAINKPEGPSLNAVIAFGQKKKQRHYLAPIEGTSFDLRAPERAAEWLQFDLERHQRGVGVRLRHGVSLGLVVHRGAQLSATRTRASTQKLPKAQFPKNLHLLNDWRSGDELTYQLSGGIRLFVGLNLAAELGVFGTIGVQNTFIMSLKKIDEKRVVLRLAEEDYRHRALSFEWGPVEVERRWPKGKILKLEFLLSLDESFHEDLYQRLIKGKVDELQKAYPELVRQVAWSGTEDELSFGWKQLAQQSRTQANYSYNSGEEEAYVRQSIVRGLLVKKRDDRDFVFADESGLYLFWTSDHRAADKKSMQRRFFSTARALGLHAVLPPTERGFHYGHIVSEIGVALTRERVEEMLHAKGTRGLLGAKVRGLLTSNWRKGRMALGKRLLKSPSLIPRLFKDQARPLKGRYLLLSSSFQSLVGELEM